MVRHTSGDDYVLTLPDAEALVVHGTFAPWSRRPRSAQRRDRRFEGRVDSAREVRRLELGRDVIEDEA